MGNTPLHLAVKSADNFPSTRSIKELLIKGASRILRDKNGNRPADQILPDSRLKTELIQLLVLLFYNFYQYYYRLNKKTFVQLVM